MIDDLFNKLTANGVKFYFSDNIIDFSLITGISLKDNSLLNLQLEYLTPLSVTIEAFKKFHFKEDKTCKNLETIKEFDKIIEDLTI